MGKAPAFMFYASDFFVDVAHWSNEDVGVYIRLLCKQWVDGQVNGHPNGLAYAVGLTPDQFLPIWERIKHKFESDGKGGYINKRLEQTRQIQKEYRDKLSKGGKKGAKKRWNQ